MNDAPTRVNAITVSDGVVYAGGCFSSIGKQTRKNIAALDTITGLATSWNPKNVGVTSYDYRYGGGGGSGSVGSVHSIIVNGPTIYVGGNIMDITTGMMGLTAIDALGNMLSTFPRYAFYVNAFTVNNGVIYLGGSPFQNGLTNLLAFYADSSSPNYGKNIGWNPTTPGPVSSLAVGNGVIYAGFSTGGIAAYNAAGTPTSWNPNVDGPVNAIAVSGSTVYIGGSFKKIGDVDFSNFAPIDAGTGLIQGQ